MKKQQSQNSDAFSVKELNRGELWSENGDSYEIDYKENTGKKKKERKPLKKKNGCLSCFLVFLVVFVLLVGGGIGAGWFLGDNLLKTNYGISLSEAFGILRQIYGADDSIVDNAPAAGDEQGFYDAVGGALFLKSGAVDSEFVLSLLPAESSENGTATVKPYKEGGEDTEGESEDGNSAIIDAVSKVLKKENLDASKLSKFIEDTYDVDAGYDSDFLIDITDKQLAAALNTLLKEYAATLGEEYKTVFENVTLSQVKLKKDDIPSMSLTLKADVKPIVKPYIEQSAAGWSDLISSVLPDVIYVSADIKLGDTRSYAVRINSMTDETMEKIFSVIQKISGQDIKAKMNEMFESAVGGVIDSLDKMGFTSGIGNGEFTFDVYNFLVDTFKEFTGSDSITKQDIALAVSNILGADFDKMLEKNQSSLYYNNYYISDGERVVYSATAINGALLIDYKKDFMKELSSKYLINYKEVDGDNGEKVGIFYYTDELGAEQRVSFDEVSDMLGIGDSGAETSFDITTLFNVEKLKYDPDTGEPATDKDSWFVSQSGEKIKLTITDKMLAAIISERLDSLLGSADDNALISSLKLQFISIENENGKDYLTLGVSADASSVLTGDTGKLFKNVIGDAVGITLKIDITLGSDTHDETLISYNNLSPARTGKILDIVNAVDKDMIETDIASKIRETLETMSSTLGGITFATGVDKYKEERGQVLLPDVFTFITEELNKSITDENKKLAEDELKTALAALVGSDYYKQLENAAAAYGYFYGQSSSDQEGTFALTQPEETVLINFKEIFLDILSDKYLLDKEALGDDTDEQFDTLLVLLGVKSAAEGQTTPDFMTAFDAGKLTETDAGGIRFIDKDSSGPNISNPVLGQLFAEVIKSKTSSDFGNMADGMEVTQTLITKNSDNEVFLEVGLTVVTDSLISSGGDSLGDMKSILKGILGEKFMVSMKIEITPEKADNFADTAITINDLTVSDTQKILTLFSKMGVDVFDSANTRSIADSVRDIINGINGTVPIGFENGKMSLPSVYGAIASLVFKEDASKTYNGEIISLTAENIHAILKGLNTLNPTSGGYISNEQGTFDDVYGSGKDNLTDNIVEVNTIIQTYGSSAGLNENFGDVIGFYNDADNGADKMYLTFSFELNSYLGSSFGESAKLLPQNIYITFEVDKSVTESGNSYKTTMKVNGMSAEDMDSLEKMIAYLTGDEDKLQSLCGQVGKLAYSINPYLALIQ